MSDSAPNMHYHTIDLRGEAAARRARAEIFDSTGHLVGESEWVTVEAGRTKSVRARLVGPPGTYTARQVTEIPTGVGENRVFIELGTVSQPSTHVLDRPSEIYRAFSALEAKILRAFVDDVRRLGKMRFFDQIPTTMSYSFDGSSTTSEMLHPDDEDTRAAVTQFRQIYNSKEPTSFRAAFKILKRSAYEHGGALRGEAIAALDDHITAEKRALAEGSGTGIVLNDQEITARKIVNAYFHGEYLHSGNDLTDLVKLLDDVGPFARMTLYTTMGRLRNVYWSAANVVDRVHRTPELLPAAS